jgi:hypothetical protein
MFDELKALTDRHADLHGDRARLQADVERLAAELEQARRPCGGGWSGGAGAHARGEPPRCRHPLQEVTASVSAIR